MVKLEPLSTEAFRAWEEQAIKEYAEDKTRAGNYTAEEALDASRKEFNKLLPDGVNTTDAYLFTVVDIDTQQQVGMLWVQVRNQRQEMFIYDIRIDENSRGKGYGRQTMLALEDFVRKMAIPKIALHVFGDNHVARHLYKSVGFMETNVIMSKVLTD